MGYQSHLSHYDDDKIPEARFSYDLSPIALTYRKEKRAFYSYITSIVAIVGGTFTVLGLIERFTRFINKQGIKIILKSFLTLYFVSIIDYLLRLRKVLVLVLLS